MKNKFLKILFVTSLALGIYSCDDYLDVNESPNNPDAEQLTPKTILPGVTSSTASTLNTTMNQLGNIMTTNWSANASDFNSPFSNEFRYNLSSTFYSGIWQNLYARMANFVAVENYEDGEDWTNFKAIAKLQKAFYMQYIVDLYGDCPYSEAWTGGAILFPKYDKDKNVYRALVSEVNDALNMIENASSSALPVDNIDIIFNGDMTEWTRFGNTLKLRLLLRQSGLTDTETTTYLADEFLNMPASGGDYLSTNATVNPGYYNSNGKQNPFFATYGQNFNGNITTSFRLVGPSAYVADFLQGNLPNTTSDPRFTSIYAPRSNSNTVGTAQGASTGRPWSLGPGVLIDSEQDLYLLTASESYFLQAEAVHKGYIFGSAQAAFDAGITSSFNTLDIGASAPGYIGSSSATDGLGWIGSTDKMQAIITQKWIALNSINGIESWIELTRTGYPSNLPLPLSTTQTSRPIRLMYPSTEYSGNTNNVPSQTLSDAFTSPIFWNN